MTAIAVLSRCTGRSCSRIEHHHFEELIENHKIGVFATLATAIMISTRLAETPPKGPQLEKELAAPKTPTSPRKAFRNQLATAW